MTVKQLFEVSEIPTSLCLDIGNGQEIMIGQEDSALAEAFGDIVIAKIMLPSQPCRVCAKTEVVREAVLDHHE